MAWRPYLPGWDRLRAGEGAEGDPIRENTSFSVVMWSCAVLSRVLHLLCCPRATAPLSPLLDVKESRYNLTLKRPDTNPGDTAPDWGASQAEREGICDGAHWLQGREA